MSAARVQWEMNAPEFGDSRGDHSEASFPFSVLINATGSAS